MAYTFENAQMGLFPIANVDSGQLSPLEASSGGTTYYPSGSMKPGTIVRANDPTYGSGEFILLSGVASTAVGDLVYYNTTSFTTTRAPTGTNVPYAIAVAMSANVSATTWGWYQISGIAVVNKSTGATVGLVATGGAIAVVSTGLYGATAASSEIQGAINVASVASAATTGQVMLNRPHMQGRIT